MIYISISWAMKRFLISSIIFFLFFQNYNTKKTFKSVKLNALGTKKIALLEPGA